MRRVRNIFVVLLISAGSAAGSSSLWAADPAPPQKPVAAAQFKVQEDLRQLMIGIFYSASNVVFAAQDDLKIYPQAEDAAVSPNPLTSIYGGWEAVQSAALAMSEASNLLLMPGRLCSNGQPVPLQRADWPVYVQVMRNAAAAAYQAALTKNQDAMVQVAGTLTQACAACHLVYRDKYQKQGNKKVCLP